MASRDELRRQYNDDYDWQQQGEEWSWAWGGSDMQWFGTWLPRLQRLLPAATILEIGAGHGRWSVYLRRYCERLILVDVADRCVAACRQRFGGDPGVACVLNDGASLDAVAGGSIDVACSFDSLVHADTEVMAAYIEQLPRILRPDGVAFLHHSNLAAVRDDPQCADEPLLHDRDPGVSAAQIHAFVTAAGLQCAGQELINWGTKRALIDGLTTITRPDGRWSQPHRLLTNPGFMVEVAQCGRLAELYGESQRAGAAIRMES